jgi:hypothetical protein
MQNGILCIAAIEFKQAVLAVVVDARMRLDVFNRQPFHILSYIFSTIRPTFGFWFTFWHKKRDAAASPITNLL